MKKYGKKKLQGKKRKSPANRKSVGRETSLQAIRGILNVLARYEKLAGLNLKYSLAQALLDRMTPEVPSAEAFALGHEPHCGGPVQEGAHFRIPAVFCC